MKAITEKLRIHNANQFKENFSELTDSENMYIFVAGPREWANTSDIPTPNTNIDYTDYGYWRNMLAAKKILAADVSNVIDRYNWANNTVYRQFDSTDPNLYDDPAAANTFYVFTDDNNVYKCLFNNNGMVSTVKPTGQAVTTIATTDGYKWKFMYNVSAADGFKFLTPQYMPVKNISANDGSPQWQVIENVANGSIDVIKVTSGGSLYKLNQGLARAGNSNSITLATTANSANGILVGSSVYITSGTGATQLRQISGYDGVNKVAYVNSVFSVVPDTTSAYQVSPTIIVNGDGSGTTAYSNGQNGTIEYINVINRGINYSTANVTITSNTLFGSNAAATPLLSPTNGHGYNAVNELGGSNILVTSQLTGQEANTFPANNDFRIFGIIKSPLNANGSLANNVSYDQTTKLTVSSASGVFGQDDIISGSNTSANATILFFANTNDSGTQGILTVTDLDGTFSVPETLNANNGTTCTLTSINNGNLQMFSGELMYIENREAIQRAPDQIEDIKIIFRF